MSAAYSIAPRLGETPWTEQEVDILKACVADGLSGSEAARKLNRSRNACVGKAIRLGFNFRSGRNNDSTRARIKSRIDASAKPVVVVAVPEPINEVVSPVPMLSLGSRQCKWPVGDDLGADQLFCGCAQVGKGPYCKRHAKPAVRRGTGGLSDEAMKRAFRRYR